MAEQGKAGHRRRGSSGFDCQRRAERRCGELLKELATTPPEERNPSGSNQHKKVSPNGAEKPQSEYTAALNRTGISTQTASQYKALANIPHDEFEHALADPVRKPSTSKLIQEARDPARCRNMLVTHATNRATLGCDHPAALLSSCFRIRIAPARVGAGANRHGRMVATSDRRCDQ
jgi:hypothetical protein